MAYTYGHIEDIKERFYNPQHAVDVIDRLTHYSSAIIDNATSMGPVERIDFGFYQLLI